jgi:hypothetical protein
MWPGHSKVGAGVAVRLSRPPVNDVLATGLAAGDGRRQ